MAVNPNWARWAFASVATFLKQLAEDAGIPALVEGLDERTTAYMESPQRVEIRMSGPFTKELSKDYYELGVDINLLFTSRYEINANQYDIIKIVGKFHEALDGPIPMLRLGNEPGDDRSLVGCLLTARRAQRCSARVSLWADRSDRPAEAGDDRRPPRHVP